MKSHPNPGVGNALNGSGDPGALPRSAAGLTGNPGQQGF